MKLTGRFKEFDEYMPTHTVKDGAWKFEMSYSSVIYWANKRGIKYKNLKNRKLINEDTGEIYRDSKYVARMLGCKNNYVTSSICKGYRCKGLKLNYYCE